MIGKKFGRLTVLEEVDVIRSGVKRKYLKCVCDCGNKKTVRRDSVRAGDIVSCGCKRGKTHGMRNTRFYSIWDNMKQRCSNPNTTNYENYGGRGIKVCDRWHSFEGFRDDMYESYKNHAEEHGEHDTSIDRINNDKGYYKANCRWATQSQQSRNQRVNSLNTSGYRGVSYDKVKEKWFAYIEIDSKRKSLGFYDEFKDAARTRRAAEAYHYGTVQLNGGAYEMELLANGAYALEREANES